MFNNNDNIRNNMLYNIHVNIVVFQMNGGSGGQSPTVQCFDAGLGVSHELGITHVCVCVCVCVCVYA